MKKLLLPALCWALAASHLFAQKSLPLSAARHSVNLTWSVKKLLTSSGYALPGEKPTSTIQPELLDVNSELQLDSTVLFSNYIGATDSTPVSRNTYTYPLTGAQVEIEWVNENGGWLPLHRNTIIKDDLERLVETMSEVYDPEMQAFVLDSRLELFPRGDSPDLVDSIFVYAWNAAANDWQRLMSILNSFDDEERLAESLTTIDVFGQPMVFKDAYRYDTNGDNTLIQSFLVEGDIEIPVNQVEMVYENHLLTSVTALVFDGSFLFIPQSRQTYQYTIFGKVERDDSYEWDPDSSDWKKTQTVFYEYDTSQRLSLKETRFFEAGGGESREQLAYSYVEDELLALEETYIWDGSGFYFLVDRNYYYYSGQTPSSVFYPLPAGNLKLYPNPVVRFVQVDLEEDASLQVFDQSGRLVLNRREQPGAITLDLFQLPAGIYSVRAVTERKYYTGKLVKQ